MRTGKSRPRDESVFRGGGTSEQELNEILNESTDSQFWLTALAPPMDLDKIS